MRVRKITDNYIVFEREATPQEILDILLSRARRDRRRGRKKRKVMTPVERTEARRRSRRKEYKAMKKLRRERRKIGVCTKCGGDRPPEYRLCDCCRTRGRGHSERSRAKKIILATYGD